MQLRKDKGKAEKNVKRMLKGLEIMDDTTRKMEKREHQLGFTKGTAVQLHRMYV